MKFTCKKNKFLENIFNMKSIPEQLFSYKGSKGAVILTNHQIIQRFFDEATAKDLIQVQQMLAQEKYSNKAISDFIKSAGNMLVKKMD